MLVAVIGGGVLHVAHCGDSRAVLCTGDAHEALELTQDHKPDSEAERARIEAVRACLPLPPSCPVRLFLPLPPSLPLTCVLPLSIALARPLSALSRRSPSWIDWRPSSLPSAGERLGRDRRAVRAHHSCGDVDDARDVSLPWRSKLQGVVGGRRCRRCNGARPSMSS